MIRPKHSTHALLVLVSMVVASPLEAATLRVEQDGSGDYRIIQDALDAAAVGDTILIGPGRYAQNSPFTTDLRTEDTYAAVSVDSLVIRGTDRDAVIIGPAVPNVSSSGPWGIAVSLETTTYVRIESLTVEHVNPGIAVFNSFVIDGVRISSCPSGINYLFGTDSVLRNSVIEDCQSLGVFTGTGVTDFTIEACTFERNNLIGVGINRTQDALVTDCTFRDGGMQYGDGSSGWVTRCQFLEDSPFGVAIESSVEMTDCVFDSSGVNVEVRTYSHLSGSGNVLLGGATRSMRFSGNSTADFHGNHILKLPQGVSVMTDAYVIEPVEIDLTGNYWGTSNPDSIAEWIVDGDDLHFPPGQLNYSDVLFEPFEAGPIPTEKESVGGLKGRYRSPE